MEIFEDKSATDKFMESKLQIGLLDSFQSPFVRMYAYLAYW